MLIIAKAHHPINWLVIQVFLFASLILLIKINFMLMIRKRTRKIELIIQGSSNIYLTKKLFKRTLL